MQAGQLKVVLNNQNKWHELAAAMGKGFVGGLTWGLYSPEVVDNYEMTIVYTPAGGGQPMTWNYQNKLRTVMGLEAILDKSEAVPRFDAIDQIAENMLVSFLCEYQAAGPGAMQVASAEPGPPAGVGVPVSANLPLGPASAGQSIPRGDSGPYGNLPTASAASAPSAGELPVLR
jgi:hypothetical protein